MELELRLMDENGGVERDNWLTYAHLGLGHVLVTFICDKFF